jgi:hypothetical protein
MQQSQQDHLMVWTWAGWEPLGFYRRLGGFHESQEGDALWQQKWADTLHSERAAKSLADAGITWATTHFFKGFGLKAEAPDMAQAAEMVRNYHRQGVKLFAYIQYGTIVPQTLNAEEPGASQWGRVDWNGQHDGHPYEYGDQYFRAKPCANQPGFIEYLQKCVTAAITAGFDGIWLDNLNSDGCHCDCCQKAFATYLQQTVRDPWNELGVPTLAGITIPRAERQRDPVFQAWTKFRCDEVRDSLKKLCDHARQTKPDVVLAANIGLGNHQRAVIENGNWISNLAPLDLTYSENGELPRWENSKFFSQHRSIKLAAAAGVGVVPGASSKSALQGPYHVPTVPSPRTLARVFAESTLMNARATGGPWGLRGESAGADPIYVRDASARSDSRQLADLHQRLHTMLRGSADAAPVAILYSFEAMLGDEKLSRAALDSVAQALMQHQVPFRYVLSDRLDPLDRVKLLILPHVLSITDEQAATIRTFVERGGKVLATGRSSLYDGAMRMRENYALSQVFERNFTNEFEARHQNAILVNPSNGCVLLPGEWGLSDASGKPYSTINASRLVQAVHQTLGPSALPCVMCPLPHVVFEMRSLAGGGLLLGLVNYADEPVHGIQIVIGSSKVSTMSKLNALTSDQNINVHRKSQPDGSLVLTLDSLSTDAFVFLS